MLGFNSIAEAPLGATSAGNFGTVSVQADVSGFLAALSATDGSVSVSPSISGILAALAATTGTSSGSVITVIGILEELDAGAGQADGAATVLGYIRAASVGAGTAAPIPDAIGVLRYYMAPRDWRYVFGDSAFVVEKSELISEDT